MRRLPAFILVLACALRAAAATPADTVLLLPFENLTAAGNAAQHLVPMMEKQISERGWKPLRLPEENLQRHRIRYLDSLEVPIRNALLTDAGAYAFLTGSVYTWREGPDPIVALSARMVAEDGRILWGNVVGLSAADTERVLGFGRAASVDQVAQHAITQLFRQLPRPGGKPALRLASSKPPWRSGPPTFRSAAMKEGGRHRVAVIPFDTASRERVAPRVIADILAIRLAAQGSFDVVEPAILRAAAREAGVRTFAFITSEDLARVGATLGTSLFLRGSIYHWADAPARGTTVPPRVDVEMSLIDTETQRIAWSAHHNRKGDDYTGLLLLGSVSNAVTLTDRVVSEIIRAFDSAPLKSAPAATAVPTAIAGTKGQIEP